MRKPTKTGSKTASRSGAKRGAATGKFVLGRNAFTRISAVEGISVSKRMGAALSGTAGMPADKRRKALTSKYGKK